MPDRVTFDFENNEVIFDMKGQTGTEIVKGLSELKTEIMRAAGYEAVDLKEELRKIGLGAYVRD